MSSILHQESPSDDLVKSVGEANGLAQSKIASQHNSPGVLV